MTDEEYVKRTNQLLEQRRARIANKTWRLQLEDRLDIQDFDILARLVVVRIDRVTGEVDVRLLHDPVPKDGDPDGLPTP